jgi:hypothetical protein
MDSVVPVPPPSTGKIALALSKAQSKIVPPEKNKTVTVKNDKGVQLYTFDYADYGAIVEAVKGPLSENELAFTHLVVHHGNDFVMLTKLIHSSGEELVSQYPLPRTTDPKQLGGAITYGKRYSLSAITGCVADDDLDSEPHNVAKFEDRKPPAKPKQTPDVRPSGASKPVVKGNGMATEPEPDWAKDLPPIGATPSAEAMQAELGAAKKKPKPAPTAAERASLFALASASRWTPDQVQGYMDFRWKKKHSDQLTHDEFYELREVISTMSFKQAHAQGAPA